MPTVLITGANRGLGLEFATQYAGEGWRVIASCRTPEKAAHLDRLAVQNAQVGVVQMDVADHGSVDACAAQFSDQSIDVLINNAGIASDDFAHQMLGGFDFENWENILRTNTLGPMKVTEAFLPNIKAGDQKKVVVVSSTVGSLTQMNAYPVYPYATSKAALNKGMLLMAEQLRSDGVSVLCLCPGHAKTDMGMKAEGASVEVEDAVAGMRSEIANLSLASTGSFTRYNGETISW
ncbi:MAG: SDR family NAD(P)-dependent oxidoreductase [Alphaproteobacteria bacterium]|nr:SDR family NAD(P)-dependent oxidoreductase [Alphaproteobacteria bacterium]